MHWLLLTAFGICGPCAWDKIDPCAWDKMINTFEDNGGFLFFFFLGNILYFIYVFQPKDS